MHDSTSSQPNERLELRHSGTGLFMLCGSIAIVGFVLAIMLGKTQGDGFNQFFFSYLVAFMFFLFLCLGGLFFVLLQHCVHAGWSVNVRRIAEWFASLIWLMGILATPIIAIIFLKNGKVFPWSAPGYLEHAHASPFKLLYLNTNFVGIRLIAYFVIWTIIGWVYTRQSVKQDATGDIEITLGLEKWAPLCLVIFGLTLTGIAFDLLMSLDPGWASTIFAVYCFAGSTLSIFAAITLIVLMLQARGYLLQSVTLEHFQDLGKFLFGFTFFYGYIAFDQYMLQWYANIPDETEWFLRHGASTARGTFTSWSWVCLLILFAHILIPFAGLLSRHVKRNRTAMGFWAAWILVMQWIDLYWIVMPQYHPEFTVGLIDVAIFLGIGGLVTAMLIRTASQHAIRPLKDPRLAASLAFENQ